VVTVDKDQCLLVYPMPDWEEIERKLMKLPSFDPRARRLQRLMVGHATELDLDAQGRVLLPSNLREFASLTRDAVLIGQGCASNCGMRRNGISGATSGWRAKSRHRLIR